MVKNEYVQPSAPAQDFTVLDDDDAQLPF